MTNTDRTRSMLGLMTTITNQEQRLTEQRRTIDVLMAALDEYGWHKLECPQFQAARDWRDDEGHGCECGYDAALALARGGHEVHQNAVINR